MACLEPESLKKKSGLEKISFLGLSCSSLKCYPQLSADLLNTTCSKVIRLNYSSIWHINGITKGWLYHNTSLQAEAAK